VLQLHQIPVGEFVTKLSPESGLGEVNKETEQEPYLRTENGEGHGRPD
jgi:hypothetical protein